MKRFAVIGSPIKHSKSPSLHEAGFSEMEIDASFEAVEVQPEDLETWIKDEFRKNFSGAAVTIPHKESVRKFLDAETDAVKKIGAVNTLFWKENVLIGTNTDAIGVLKALQTMVNPADKKVLILGAGGTSRAVLFALQTAKSDITLWNRTKERAEKLAEDFEQLRLAQELETLTPEDFDIVINATSVGLGEWKSVLPEDFWRSSHIAFDVVYEPLETKFLSDAENAGAQTITGDQMLIHQAIEQFRIWHDVELDPDVMAGAFFEG